jgi:hypothetical protein
MTIKIETTIGSGVDPFRHPLYDHSLVKEETELLVDPVKLMATVEAVAAERGIALVMCPNSEFVTKLCCTNAAKVKATFGGIVFSYNKENPQLPDTVPESADSKVWQEFFAAFNFFKVLMEEKNGTVETLCHALNALMVMTVCAGKDKAIAQWTCTTQNNEFFDKSAMFKLVKADYHPTIAQAAIWINGMRK